MDVGVVINHVITENRLRGRECSISFPYQVAEKLPVKKWTCTFAVGHQNRVASVSDHVDIPSCWGDQKIMTITLLIEIQAQKNAVNFQACLLNLKVYSSSTTIQSFIHIINSWNPSCCSSGQTLWIDSLVRNCNFPVKALVNLFHRGTRIVICRVALISPHEQIPIKLYRKCQVLLPISAVLWLPDLCENKCKFSPGKV